MVSFGPLRDADGSIIGAVTSFYDISESKKAEQRQREADARYQTLFDSIDEGFCVIEMLYNEAGAVRDYRFEEVNPAFEAQSGLRDARGRQMRELTPEHEEHWFETYDRVAQSGEPIRFEAHAGALNRWFDVYAFRVGAPQARRVAVLFKDISERKLTELKLRAVTDDLNAEVSAMKRLHELSTRLVGKRKLQSLLEEVLACAMSLEDAESGLVQLLNPENGELEIAAECGVSANLLAHFRIVEDNHNASSGALQGRRHVIIEDVATDPFHRGLASSACYRAAHFTPLYSRDAEPLGVLATMFRAPHRPNERQLRVMDLYARIAAELIERKQAEEALRQSESFLQSVIQSSSDCIKVLDLEGRFRWMSANGLCAMEIPDLGHIRGIEWLTFWEDDETRERARLSLEAAREGKIGRFQGFCATMTGTPKWWDVAVSAIRGADGVLHAFLSVSRDITERRRAEESLRLSEERYRALTHATTNTVWRMSGDGRALLEVRNSAGPAAPGGEVPNEDWVRRSVPVQEQSELLAKLHRALAERSLYEHEHTTRSGSGEIRHWHSRAVPMLAENGEVREWVGASIDITERKCAEAELRRTLDELESRVAARTAELAASNDARQRLLERLLTAEDMERRRISRELHDQVGQQLTGLSLGLRAINARLALSGGAVPELETIVDSISKEVHDLALELRPSALDNAGLAAALASYIDLWSRRANVCAQLHHTGCEERLPVPIEIAAYRVALEALTNIARHARARHVSIVVKRRPAELLLIVEDDGIGFDVAQTLGGGAQNRLGLLGMRERAEACDGSIDLESFPGRGTTVYCHLPLSKNEIG